ncbi:hypothetical protein CEUSTIGMA_g2102.t1 [Chlamydomonas eustigma]|uniref:OTU domain-containing protein n=1 Tax=Chlamydomonas eustigma TaxID=1157962 RepID=A0A250WUY7_9CHLO|nr:hypothetical protein CEUSTIGMA_g2102.t1 [Chlamydomonas eustigma]|eukprot:GAX74654.1 hypothetical protein CEUSTIGMA_g2102.t1 [Chlamydomonas eustigma]
MTREAFARNSSSDVEYFPNMDRETSDLHERLSKAETPIIASRDVLTINLGCIDEVKEFKIHHGGEVAVAAEALVEAHQPHGFVRVSAVSASGHADEKAAVEPSEKAHLLMRSPSRQLLEELIKAECKAAAITGSGVQISQGRQLRERLDRLHLDMIKICMDGNCQFRVLSLELFDTQDRHLEVRQTVIKYIVDNREEFVAFLGEDFDSYVEGMSKQGTWGDELTLRSAAEAYNAIVRCLSSMSTSWYISYEPKEPKGATKELFLAYIAPYHYNALKRRSTLSELGHRVGSGFTRLSHVISEHAAKKEAHINPAPYQVEYNPFRAMCCIPQSSSSVKPPPE